MVFWHFWKQGYGLHAKGHDYKLGDLVWVYNPVNKRGSSPDLDSHWVGVCMVCTLAQMSAYVYAFCLDYTAGLCLEILRYAEISRGHSELSYAKKWLL